MKRKRWMGLCARIAPAGEPRFDRLASAYAERHRHYHTGQHIEECLALLDDLRELCLRADEVEYAIWLHDVVYVPGRSDNEARSADLARRWLVKDGAARETGERVADLILATAHDGAVSALGGDVALLVDIDLHVLGSDPERYAEYEAQVRAEYRWVPGPLFRRARIRILGAFLGQDPLYRTESCRERFEGPARRNLATGLARLAGEAPG